MKYTKLEMEIIDLDVQGVDKTSGGLTDNENGDFTGGGEFDWNKPNN